MSLEGVLESKHALKRYTPESLGQGKPRGGKAAEQKLRYEVLERIASLGTGLTPAQKNDWRWFRETWDAKMCSEHGADWGGIFSGWMQKILDDLSKGVSNAFSVFVHDETQRHFASVPMLTVLASSLASASFDWLNGLRSSSSHSPAVDAALCRGASRRGFKNPLQLMRMQ